MTQIPSTEVVASDVASKPASGKAKRITQMAGAAALSIGLVGTFSLPAYAATPEPEGLPDGFTQSAPAQTLQAVNVDAEAEALPAVAPEVGESEALLAQEAEQKAKEAKEKADSAAAQTRAASDTESATETTAATTGKDVPAGVGGQGIADAALAQLGDAQDCTALVERSLRAVGIPAGDLGTQVGEYTALGGTIVSGGDYAPGDVLVFPGQHVAVYVGNGQAVHGGWGGITKLGPIAPGGETGLTVVRF